MSLLRLVNYLSFASCTAVIIINILYLLVWNSAVSPQWRGIDVHRASQRGAVNKQDGHPS